MKKPIEKFNRFISSLEYNTSIILNYKINDHIITLRKSKFTHGENFVILKFESQHIEEHFELDSNYSYGNIIIPYEPENNIGQLVFDKLNNIKFNKYFSSYDIPEKDNQLFDIELELFPEFFKYRICSVCLENTKNKTNCGHFLCCLCWEGMIKIKNYACPECRECIRFTNSICYMDECPCK